MTSTVDMATDAAKPGTVGIVANEVADSVTEIDTLRGQIDALDTAIARLVGERAALSQRIQTARINAGGTRIELGRERAILDHYRASLGPAGAGVADAVLRACRGAR